MLMKGEILRVHREQHFTVVDLIIDKSRRRIKEVKIFCNQRCAINLAQTRVRCPPPPPRSPPPPGNGRIPRTWGVVTSAESVTTVSINKSKSSRPRPASQPVRRHPPPAILRILLVWGCQAPPRCQVLLEPGHRSTHYRGRDTMQVLSPQSRVLSPES